MDAQLMGLLSGAAGGLEASGPSRTPVSMGQVLSRGLLSGMQGYQGQEDRNQRAGLLGLQTQQLQTALAQAAQRQKAIQDFAQTVPEDQRAMFMANPEGYLGAKAKAMEPFSLRPGEQRIQGGQVVASAPESYTMRPGDTRMQGGSPIASMPAMPETAPDALGVLRYKTGPNVGQAVPGFEAEKPPEGFKRGPNGNWAIDPGYLEGKTQIAAAGRPVNNVNVKVDNKAGESLAKPIGEMVQGSREQALGAVSQIDTVNRIRQALDTGSVIAGPGTTLRMFGDQIAQVTGVGGQDSAQRLANTRGVIKGLAEFTLSGRKALAGQGSVSDQEGRLLEKAASGDIDSLTIPEIKIIVDVTERQARKLHAAHSKNMETLRSNPSYNQLAPFYEVPQLPDMRGPSADKPQSKNFTIGGKGYIGQLNPQTGNYEVTIDGRRHRIEE